MVSRYKKKTVGIWLVSTNNESEYNFVVEYDYLPSAPSPPPPRKNGKKNVLSVLAKGHPLVCTVILFRYSPSKLDPAANRHSQVQGLRLIELCG